LRLRFGAGASIALVIILSTTIGQHARDIDRRIPNPTKIGFSTGVTKIKRIDSTIFLGTAMERV
jgi:hypothetical protein